MIEGVECKALTTYTDERGFFREIIRGSDSFFAEGFAQWSHSLVHHGAAKAWHWHKKQVDWWYVAMGVLKVVLHDLREKSSTFRRTEEFLLGDNQFSVCLRIPPGVAHGCKCIQGPAHLFYVTSREYDVTDAIRIAHDDPVIAYDWLSPPTVK